MVFNIQNHLKHKSIPHAFMQPLASEGMMLRTKIKIPYSSKMTFSD